MMGLIYTICSKNLSKKDFHGIFSANYAKFFRCKEAKTTCERNVVLESKIPGSHKYTRKFHTTHSSLCIQRLETNFNEFQ